MCCLIEYNKRLSVFFKALQIKLKITRFGVYLHGPMVLNLQSLNVIWNRLLVRELFSAPIIHLNCLAYI